MRDTIKILEHNASHVKIDTEMHIYQGLYDHFAFRPKGYQYTPNFKAKIWDGYIRLMNTRARTLPIGLIPRLEKYASQIGADIDFSDFKTDNNCMDVTYNEVKEFADSLNIMSKGVKIEPHDYQIETVFHAIKNGRMVALAPTSAGKSLILYIYLNWFLRKTETEKMLLIVPSVQLVHQMFDDFKDYASDNDMSPDDYCHLIMGGKEKQSDKPIYISTWQSLQNIAKGSKSDALYNMCYFQQFGLVAVDEVHTAKGKQLSNILDLCIEAYNRLGVTGTLDGTDLMQIQLEGMFGTVYKVITTRELMDRGAVSTMDIKCLMLNYPDEVKKNSTKLTYQEEIDYLVTNPERLKFVSNLAKNLTGNTLILVNFIEKHGQPLYDSIREKVGPDRKVFFFHGGVDGEERNDIKKIIENENDAIIVGSFGVISTGVSIKRLHNVIFASPSKSQIRVLQSLGRGLRLGSDKNHCVLYDIGDDLSWKKHKNYALLHAIERIKMYMTQQFNYKLIKVDLKK